MASKKSLEGKKVLVYGLGRSGQSALRLLSGQACEVFATNSGEVESWCASTGLVANHCFTESEAPFEQMDYIILSPGIPREHPLLKSALKKGVEIICEVELASWFFSAPILALTGTNGKTTTVTLLGEILRDQGLNVFVGGNIGIPFCEAITSDQKWDLAVLELSSFQLESTPTLHPEVAGILNITFSHGERYRDLESYIRAKLRIARHLGSEDTFVAPKNNSFLPSTLKGTLPESREELIGVLAGFGVEVDKVLVPGVHNLFNIAFALTMVEAFYQRHPEFSLDTERMRETIYHFKGVSHRIEALALSEKVMAYNDSKSTNWESTRVAVHAMREAQRPVALIIGGQKRGRADEVGPHLSFLCEHVDLLILIGETAPDHERECQAANATYSRADTLEHAARLLKEELTCGTILFSPAAPSFDQFKSYADRGETFKRIFLETFHETI